MIAKSVLALMIAAAVYHPAAAMDFDSRPVKKGVVISLHGVIEKGDFAKLSAFINKRPKDDFVVAFSLDSNGGNVAEAANIGEFFAHFPEVAVVVEPNKQCVSACFILFASGKTRIVAVGARIGVHSAAKIGHENEESMETYGATTMLARLYNKYHVPPAIIGKMVITTNEQISWLTAEDLASMNVTILK